MKIYCIILTTLLLSLNSFAQQPNGDGRRMPPPDRGGRPHMDKKGGKDMMFNTLSKDIPNLTLEQREKLGSILSKENEKIEKEFSKKRDLENARSQLSENDQKKVKSKLDKIDKNMEKIKSESNKKVNKILDQEQYQIFIMKRDQFKFNKPRGERPKREWVENIESINNYEF